MGSATRAMNRTEAQRDARKRQLGCRPLGWRRQILVFREELPDGRGYWLLRQKGRGVDYHMHGAAWRDIPWGPWEVVDPAVILTEAAEAEPEYARCLCGKPIEQTPDRLGACLSCGFGEIRTPGRDRKTFYRLH